MGTGKRQPRSAPTALTITDGTVSLADLLGERPTWQDAGLCPQTDPEAFFPEKGGSTREAKKICKLCPSKADCLSWALERREQYGIWGGLSERERRRISRAGPGAAIAAVRAALADTPIPVPKEPRPTPKKKDQVVTVVAVQSEPVALPAAA